MFEKSDRRSNLIRTSKNGSSFISKSASIYNKMSQEFRTLRVNVGQARKEAKMVVQGLPMF